MQTIENAPTTIHAVAYTDPDVTHYVRVDAGLYLATGQPNLLAAETEAELIALCEQNNVALLEIPAEGEEVQEGLYDNAQPQGVRIASTNAVICRIAHTREATDVTQDSRFIASADVTPKWVQGEQVSEGTVREHEGTLYRCVQQHRTQFTPDLVPALWRVEPDPDEEWPAWVQPTGAQDAYIFNAKVSHNGKKWVSQRRANVWEPGTFDAGWQQQVEADPEWPIWQQPIPGLTGREPYAEGAQVTHLGDRWVSTAENNVWEPGVFGWEKQADGTQEWQVGVAYNVGDIVTYEGTEYRCIQAHTSIAPWIPPNVPALWEEV